ncbi:MAG: hypothetical protein RQM92_13025 [Candidatus Syntrophopropionicum ammoniitolerans]
MQNLNEVRGKYQQQYKEKIARPRIVVGLGTHVVLLPAVTRSWPL